MSRKDFFIFLFILSYHMSNTDTSSVSNSLDTPKHFQFDNSSFNLTNLNNHTSSSLHSLHISKSTTIVPIEGGGGSQLVLESKPVTEENVNRGTESRKISARKGVVFNESDNISSSLAPTQSFPLINSSKALNITSSTVGISAASSTIKTNSNSAETTNSTTSTTTHKPILPLNKKPFFTMISDDHVTMESESFIESPTTGKDYVLPIVLIILALPILLFIIKLIYKRGTEFTERQQYHRMYLIDGMYNTR